MNLHCKSCFNCRGRFKTSLLASGLVRKQSHKLQKLGILQVHRAVLVVDARPGPVPGEPDQTLAPVDALHGAQLTVRAARFPTGPSNAAVRLIGGASGRYQWS